jgi:hypothetical protein
MGNVNKETKKTGTFTELKKASSLSPDGKSTRWLVMSGIV